jgi:hypothetical protein
MKKLFLPFALFISSSIFAQDTSSVVIHKDRRIDLLIKKQMEINDITTRDARKMSKGFRLLVVNTTNREEAINAKTKLYQYFPDLKSYLVYHSPYYKLKAGNFKEKEEAEDFQKKLDPYFPKGVFVMNDVIEINPDKNTNETEDQ